MKRLYESSAYGVEPDPGNYWQSVSPPEPGRFPPLDGERRVDAVVIGAGITGLAAARRLATRGLETLVLEAAWPAWGASGRAGGFVCLGGSMLEDRQLVRRHGAEEADRFHDFQRAAIEEAAAFIEASGADVGRHSEGEWQLAHRPGRMDDLHAEARALRARYGIAATVHDRAALAERGMAGPEFHGGLHVPIGFAVDPRAYALAHLAAAEAAGVRVHGDTPATALAVDSAGVGIETPSGRVRADRAIFATNGYGPDDWPSGLQATTLPVLSHVQVTRKLTAEERAAQGWTSADMAFDSRILLHYFRLMPDGRFLFGTRGGVSAAPAALADSARRARRDFERMFPAWATVETPYCWSGLVCLTATLTPFVGPVDDSGRVFAALGYHGNGLALSRKAGRAVADLATGHAAADALPAPMRGPLRRFPLAPARRLGLRAAYAAYGLKDALL